MEELNAYIEEKNSWCKLFDSRPLHLQNSGDRKRIAECIERDMVAESNAMYGEADPSYINRKREFLKTVAEQLKKIDPKVSL